MTDDLLRLRAEAVCDQPITGGEVVCQLTALAKRACEAGLEIETAAIWQAIGEIENVSDL